MNDSTGATHIRPLATVLVPVVGQYSSPALYVDKLGFKKRAELAYGNGSRCIEVARPGSTIAVALVSLSEAQTAGGDQTHCAFTTDGIEADRATLRTRAVRVDRQIARKGTPGTGLNSVAVAVAVPDPVTPHSFSVTLTATGL